MVRTLATPKPYHHGQLRESLVEAGLELARPDGPSGLGLRAASRLAGVSHNAAYRHFADYDALLSAVGARCMRELALQMEKRQSAVRDRDPVVRAWSRLNAIGETYVDFAVKETGWFRTAFAAHPNPPEAMTFEGVATGDSGRTPYGLLGAQLDELVEVGAITPDRRPGLEYAAWAAVHGMSMLLTDGPLRGLRPAERRRARAVVLNVVSDGLAGPPT